MALVTGTLADFGRGNLAARNPELVFTPSAATTTIDDSYLLTAVPIVVTPSADGSFTVDLEPVDNMTTPVFYRIQVRLLDSVAGYVFIDFPDWRLAVPFEGGALHDLVPFPVAGGAVWTTATGDIPDEAVEGDLLFDTSTSDLFRLI